MCGRQWKASWWTQIKQTYFLVWGSFWRCRKCTVGEEPTLWLPCQQVKRSTCYLAVAVKIPTDPGYHFQPAFPIWLKAVTDLTRHGLHLPLVVVAELPWTSLSGSLPAVKAIREPYSVPVPVPFSFQPNQTVHMTGTWAPAQPGFVDDCSDAETTNNKHKNK